MSDYDSEDEEVVGSTVLLGFAGKAVGSSKLSTQDNHIGGLPLWLDGTPPPADLIECGACGSELTLLAQLSCPIDEKLYDRVLYIFVCRNSECRRKDGAVRALRGIHSSDAVKRRIEAEIGEPAEVELEKELQDKLDLGDKLFSGASVANPFAAGVMATESEKPLTSKHFAAARSDKFTVFSESAFVAKLVDVEDEFIDEAKPMKLEDFERLVDDDQTPDTPLDADLATLAKSLTDDVFAKFASRVAQNPEQILRYNRPLDVLPFCKDKLYKLFTKEALEDRIFEVQLMPHLISELESEDMLEDGMEWGTIVVATKEEDPLPNLDANGVGYVEEWVGVQWEGSI